MRLLKFDDYRHYVSVQTAANKAKIDKQWVGPDECAVIANTIRRLVPGASWGICHGVRSGYEVRELHRLTGATAIGTDISDTAAQFPFVMQRDFHEEAPEWKGRADFIYSNSLDHSYDPELAVKRWAACVNERGILILHWSTGHDYPEFANDGADCFAGSRADYTALLSRWFRAIETVPIAPRGEGHEAEQCLIIGKRVAP